MSDYRVDYGRSPRMIRRLIRGGDVLVMRTRHFDLADAEDPKPIESRERTDRPRPIVFPWLGMASLVNDWSRRGESNP
jgi:hypothetical protein